MGPKRRVGASHNSMLSVRLPLFALLLFLFVSVVASKDDNFFDGGWGGRSDGWGGRSGWGGREGWGGKAGSMRQHVIKGGWNRGMKK
ncbi:hypothetical protein PRIPAC_78397 [Pristionchus pacificus]|uniref:Uncharacterized protein n=1 Tax=Pristionchus pacificus TaxID=54126 RepID=A0A2A6C4J6_PRIPA|nr:hypothetical protein PRIPAC_78397 [Pristionchus pacificus]|eukprot:PDM73095.1 hypothetical protein PRIPAC_39529 [Pristionchus pacificus]